MDIFIDFTIQCPTVAKECWRSIDGVMQPIDMGFKRRGDRILFTADSPDCVGIVAPGSTSPLSIESALVEMAGILCSSAWDYSESLGCDAEKLQAEFYRVFHPSAELYLDRKAFWHGRKEYAIYQKIMSYYVEGADAYERVLAEKDHICIAEWE